MRENTNIHRQTKNYDKMNLLNIFPVDIEINKLLQRCLILGRYVSTYLPSGLVPNNKFSSRL